MDKITQIGITFGLGVLLFLELRNLYKIYILEKRIKENNKDKDKDSGAVNSINYKYNKDSKKYIDMNELKGEEFNIPDYYDEEKEFSIEEDSIYISPSMNELRIEDEQIMNNIKQEFINKRERKYLEKNNNRKNNLK